MGQSRILRNPGLNRTRYTACAPFDGAQFAVTGCKVSYHHHGKSRRGGSLAESLSLEPSISSELTISETEEVRHHLLLCLTEGTVTGEQGSLTELLKLFLPWVMSLPCEVTQNKPNLSCIILAARKLKPVIIFPQGSDCSPLTERVPFGNRVRLLLHCPLNPPRKSLCFAGTSVSAAPDEAEGL
jgi:hypothetical protein